MTYHTVSIKNRQGKYDRFEVPKEVYIYIGQLETCIRYPEKSKLKELYPERLGQYIEGIRINNDNI